MLWQQEAELARGRRLGMTFTNFALGAPFRNEKRIFGYQGGAPDGAIIYPLKTRILVCDEHADSVLRWSFDMKYACFRDEIGDWTCPSTASKKLEQIYLPRT